MIKAFFLFIAVLATCASVLTVLFLDRSEWPEQLRKTIGAAVLNFGIYAWLRWAEKTGKEREKQITRR